MSKKLTPGAVALRLAEIESARRAALETLADEVRKQHVVPACKKAGLNYIAGNGTFCFFDATKPDYMGTSIGTIDDAVLEEKTYLCPVIDMLNLEVGRNDVLGFYVSDVKVVK
jgi:hypothetical protein